MTLLYLLFNQNQTCSVHQVASLLILQFTNTLIQIKQTI